MSAMRNNQQQSSSTRLMFIGCALAVTILMIANVGMQMYVLSLENGIRAIRQEQGRATAKIQSCELKIAALKKGSRIKAIASDTLGMEVPEGAPEKLF